MEAIFFNLPGLLSLFICIRGTSPVPHKEWLLVAIPPVLSFSYLYLAYLIRYNFGIPFWDTFGDLFIPFISMDGICAEILSEVGIFNLSGIYSLSIVLALISSFCLKGFIRKKIFSPLSNPKSFDVYDAALNENLYFIETKNKKVYVGRVYCGPTTGNNPESFVTITPVMSGYRNDLNIVIYENFYDASSYSVAANLDSIKIHLIYSHIASIREFSWEAFKHFVQKGTSVTYESSKK